jgi:transcription initiation factor TFIIB
MGTEYDIPDVELEYAARLYHKAHAAGLVAGRSANGFATACLLVAVRKSPLQLPVSLRELEEVARATEDQIKTARGALEVRMEIEIPPLEPQDLIPKVTSEFDIHMPVERCAKTLLRAFQADDETDCHGFSPRTLTGAALHAAYDIIDCDNRPTLSQLSDVLCVSESTISQRKSYLLQYKGVWE